MDGLRKPHTMSYNYNNISFITFISFVGCLIYFSAFCTYCHSSEVNLQSNSMGNSIVLVQNFCHLMTKFACFLYVVCSCYFSILLPPPCSQSPIGSLMALQLHVASYIEVWGG